jgi:tetratricopeptide (TPR) repeat protein
MNCYTLHFLNAFLKNDESSKEFLTRDPVNNHIPDQLVTVQRKEAIPSAFSFEQVHVAARKQGYRDLENLVKRLKQQHPALVVQEWKLNNLGLQLLFKGRTQEGLRILALATTLYPQSANAFDSLAEGYLLKGDKQQAIIAFKQSLALDPQNQNAVVRLNELQKN